MFSVAYTGLIVLAGSILFMFLIVPIERIKKLLLIGLVAGIGIAILLVYVMNLFDFWTFHGADVLNLYGIPIFLSLAWVPLVIAFIHLFTEFYQPWQRVGLVLLFPAGAIILHYLLLQKGALTYKSWNLFFTYIVSVIIHFGIFVWFEAKVQLKN
ncbi:MAG: hypothetical protein CVU87_06355 [Firmicutes bacterium HGW-Firmicutes-12]|jgi:hypothetical protein|nr:MAG: hypothetical protein CVU87_06355 [Firmicutes bacterium HGW-Firmicutes-12]